MLSNAWTLVVAECDARAETLFHALRSLGFGQIVRASNRQETINILMSVSPKPAVALLILDKPHSSIADAVHFAATVCPCVVISSSERAFDKEKDLSVGSVEFITEPVSLDRIRAKVETVLAGKSAGHEGEVNSTFTAEAR